MNITEKINRLKTKNNAVILAHNYQLPEIQDIADFVGDSLGLSRIAAQTTSSMIVFCGVYFMAETAKILSPGKTVIIPDINAGCPMAEMIDVPALRDLKKKHQGAKVLCYVNTSAEVKAECDICCTSANAVNIVNTLLKEEKEIIFVPDKYLANYIAGKTNRNFIVANGYCPSHIKILPGHIKEKKKVYPRAEVLVHPECVPDTIALADKVSSTEGMCKYAKAANAREFIIGTEPGIIYRLRKENPDKFFYPVSEEAICPNMKLTTSEKVLWALEDMKYEITLPKDVIARAQKSIMRMLDSIE